MNKLIKQVVVAGLSSLSVFVALSDDIELYDYAARIDWGIRPKVLIIFDNSGSMGIIEEGTSGYDPDKEYGSVQGLNSFNDRYIYYTAEGIDETSAPVPDSPSETRRFREHINACAAAVASLNTVGYYVGRLLEYERTGKNKDTWQEMPDNDGSNLELIDCQDDITLANTWNADNWQDIDKGWSGATTNGYPVDDQTYPYQSGVDGVTPTGSPDLFNSASTVTLYTDNYLRWYHGGCVLKAGTSDCDPDVPSVESKSRLQWAKDAVNNVVSSVNAVDFGLMVFNINAFDEYARDGGRLVLKVDEYDAETEFSPVVNSLQANTNTPLCETMYEAYRYIAGLSVMFGDDDGKPVINGREQNTYDYSPNSPPRDSSAEIDGIYASPFDKCVNQMTVILVTDGAPTVDSAANTSIKDDFGITSPYVMGNGVETYLPPLTQALYKNDILSDEENYPGKQTLNTYIIGMGDITSDPDAVEMLTEAAVGGYYNATDMSTGLESALLDIVYQTLTNQATYTSPAVATNNFDRTQNLDSVYYAMFLPTSAESKLHWWGNLKKYKVVDDERIEDVNGNAAMSEFDGNIVDTAHSYWSSAEDGDDVTKGGVLEHLQKRVAERKFYADSGTQLALIETFANNNSVAASLGVEQAEVADYIKWIQGVDVDDEDGDGSTTDKRSQLVADILHSRPLALNYGGNEASQDVRLVVGTNAGVLHMFKDNGGTVEESWAYLPNEYWSLQKELRHYTGARNYYGIDGSPVAFSYGDKVWLYFGVRRGGKTYYAMDITNPDSPSLMWRIDNNSNGFELLGQTWSEPVVTYVNGIGKGTPVMIIAGGYDTNKDAHQVGSDDSVGRGVYLVNAATGALIWSTTSATYSGFKDSMPGKVAALDSDQDGLVDRLYVSDTGANIFRIDMPTDDKSTWTVHKFASLGDVATEQDRRFFYEPAVAQTVVNIKTETVTTDDKGAISTVVTNQTVPFDAVMLGTGNRSHPLDVTTNDMFFMLQDRNVQTASLTDSEISERGGVIQLTDLYDATGQAINQNNTDSERQTELLSYGQKRGWYHKYSGLGEKSLSSPIVIEGTVYYTTYTPATSAIQIQQCIPVGQGRIYGVDLQYGYNEFEWDHIDTGTNVPDTPQLFAGENNVSLICGGCEVITKTDSGEQEMCIADECQTDSDGTIDNPDLIETPLQLAPQRIYFYNKEVQ
ncbi:type IV pili system adhesin PilY [Neiella marina]|uniref:Type IV pili system adhesin PilY n=1 Tax=Neiella marina TaxID=508461 RepID=A0A8J2U3E0_9GAMM|nr:PilC/PilY family type IV pilus protein [Neiella marina]GGA70960.1 type IV pili system adhesin PilY [Neiella marina]